MADIGPVVRSTEWLRHRVADKVSRPGVDGPVTRVLGRVGNLTTYTFIAPFDQYAEAAHGLVASMTADLELVVCHNRWGRAGVQGLSCVLRPASGGALVEAQVDTPASAGAREHAHLLRDMIRQAGRDSARAADLRRRQGHVLAAVPVPSGAAQLSWPGGCGG